MPPRKKKKEEAISSTTKDIATFFSSTASKRETRKRKNGMDEIPEEELGPRASKLSPDLSPDQRDAVASKKYDAQAKLWAKKLNASSLGPSWMKVLMEEFKKPYFTILMESVQTERKNHTVYPPAADVFSWTTLCPIQDIKVVIIGQDPYHGPSQAHGLCFSVKVGVSTPPSLVNMYKELEQSVEGFKIPDHGHLVGWAKQGVLLLNACLTVRHKTPNSHAGKGWEKLTDAVIHWLNDNRFGLVFMLWGAYAQKKGAFINTARHCVLKTAHPSPLSASRGFFGCKHFTLANNYLVKKGHTPIDWTHLPKTLDSK